MNSGMNWLENFVAIWLARRLICQRQHQDRLTELFMILRIQAELEFKEDSPVGLDTFFRESMEEAHRIAKSEIAFFQE